MRTWLAMRTSLVALVMCCGCGDSLTEGGFQGASLEGSVTSVTAPRVAATSYVGIAWNLSEGTMAATQVAPLALASLPVSYRLELLDAPPASAMVPLSLFDPSMKGSLAIGWPIVFGDTDGDHRYSEPVMPDNLPSESQCAAAPASSPACDYWTAPRDDLRGVGQNAVLFLKDADQPTLELLETVGAAQGLTFPGARAMNPGYNLAAMSCTAQGVTIGIIPKQPVAIIDATVMTAASTCSWSSSSTSSLP